ncbi:MULTISPECIES: formamidase [Paraburkholderia]|uniref:Formamidase n=1 Tax=Paraburkholderia podalyriae TaxID=1938811 RepID=A0ABR7Q1R3_9BURK|nr:formamidase [Paraburkholderia podalyriae]MBC8752491.1 formamidase [Paraburkholderia podalyriae]
MSSSGLGGLNRSPAGVVIGLVQLQNPNVETPAQLAAQTQRVVELVGKARRNNAAMDLVVFPEYALHGLSMRTDDAIMCSLDGPEVAAFKAACVEHRIWGCFSIMERNPGGNPYNSGLIIDDQGVIQLYYRKLHPWVPVEPWEPGNLGVPVCTGPRGVKLGLIICHDGMFPEMAREAAYKGAEVILRTGGIHRADPPRVAHHQSVERVPESRADGERLSVRSDGTFDSMGEGMFCDFDGTVMVEGSHRPDEVIVCEMRPDLVREARIHWGVENNIYQFGHRGYVAVKGGAQDCPYTFMHDMVRGEYRLPWEAEVRVTDGTPCGFAPPERIYKG